MAAPSSTHPITHILCLFLSLNHLDSIHVGAKLLCETRLFSRESPNEAREIESPQKAQWQAWRWASSRTAVPFLIIPLPALSQTSVPWSAPVELLLSSLRKSTSSHSKLVFFPLIFIKRDPNCLWQVFRSSLHPPDYLSRLDIVRANSKTSLDRTGSFLGTSGTLQVRSRMESLGRPRFW